MACGNYAPSASLFTLEPVSEWREVAAVGCVSVRCGVPVPSWKKLLHYPYDGIKDIFWFCCISLLKVLKSFGHTYSCLDLIRNLKGFFFISIFIKFYEMLTAKFLQTC